MKKIIFIIGFLGLAIPCNAQFQGGNADGSAVAIIYGINLYGDVTSLAVMFRGSDGDGFDSNTSTLSLGNNNLQLYEGGLGDGFSNALVGQTLTGINFAILYSGSDGDGYSNNMASAVTLSGQDLAQLYNGSDGDGFAVALLPDTLLEGFMTELYEGGDGDGFSVALLPDTVLEGFMTELYEGGDGDGFAVELSLSNLLSGNLVDIYEGGDGDGFAVFELTTTLTLDVVEELIQMNVLMYPNPATDIVHLKLPDGIIVSSVELFDVSGKRIEAKLSREHTIDVSRLPSGLYLVNIIAEEGRSVKKLIIK